MPTNLDLQVCFSKNRSLLRIFNTLHRTSPQKNYDVWSNMSKWKKQKIGGEKFVVVLQLEQLTRNSLGHKKPYVARRFFFSGCANKLP